MEGATPSSALSLRIPLKASQSPSPPPTPSLSIRLHFESSYAVSSAAPSISPFMNSNRPTGSLAACIRRSPGARDRLLSPDRDDQGGRQSRLGQNYAADAGSDQGSIIRGGSLDADVIVEVPSMRAARAARALPSFRRSSTDNDLELVEVPSARTDRGEGSNEGARDVIGHSDVCVPHPRPCPSLTHVVVQRIGPYCCRPARVEAHVYGKLLCCST